MLEEVHHQHLMQVQLAVGQLVIGQVHWAVLGCGLCAAATPVGSLLGLGLSTLVLSSLLLLAGPTGVDLGRFLAAMFSRPLDDADAAGSAVSAVFSSLCALQPPGKLK